MEDEVYCTAFECPYQECQKHLCHLKRKEGTVNVGNFYKTCRWYIGMILSGANNGDD